MAIRNIFSKGFKNTSLFEVSLVEDITPDLPTYAERFFMFFKMSPQIDGKFSPKENSVSKDCQENFKRGVQHANIHRKNVFKALFIKA